MLTPSASYSLTMRVRLPRHPGAFATVAAAIGEAGGLLGAIDLVRASQASVVRDVTVNAVDSVHGQRIVDAVRELDEISVESVSDRTFLLHLGGKIEVTPKVPIRTRDDLSMAYTPGVARVCLAIHEQPSRAHDAHDQAEHGRRRDRRHGGARPRRHRPGGGDARDGGQGDALQGVRRRGRLPASASTRRIPTRSCRSCARSPRASAASTSRTSPRPRCFEVERRLRDELDIPVFHDDQHGTAIVVLAAFLNALKVVGKQAQDVRVVIVGVGAAGKAVSDILLDAGVRDLIGCDIGGTLHSGRQDLGEAHREFAQRTNPRCFAGTPTRRCAAPT